MPRLLLASSAIHCRFVDTVVGFSVPSRVSRQLLSMLGASLPSLGTCPAHGPRSGRCHLAPIGGLGAAPASKRAKAPANRVISGLTTGLQHALSTLQGRRCRAPARLASG